MDEKQKALPRLRVPSQPFSDYANVTQRTVSSSTLLLSTPSNNIRRVQQMTQAKSLANSRLRHKPREVHVLERSSGTASKKLLNLQQLRKSSALRPFVLRKPAALASYDYSVFGGGADEQLATVKESQIRAWELAEKVSAAVVFDHDSAGLARLLDPEKPATGEDSLLRSIPRYTKAELDVILAVFERLRTTRTRLDPVQLEETEQKALWVYRQQENAAQERAFAAHHTLQGKRKIQVFHKKDFLHKLFGYANTLNQEYNTNNTSYSAYDNVASAQKAFQEDKDEIMTLLAEDKAFEDDIAQLRQQLEQETPAPPGTSVLDMELTPVNLLQMALLWLTSHYDGEVDDDEANTELVACLTTMLKQKVKDSSEETSQN